MIFFLLHHTIMIITIFFSSKTHRIDRDHYLLSFHHIVYTVRSWWLLYSFFPSHHMVGDHQDILSLYVTSIDRDHHYLSSKAHHTSYGTWSSFSSKSLHMIAIIIFFFKRTSYDLDHHYLISSSSQSHPTMMIVLSYFFFFTITSYNDSLTIIEWLLLLQQYSNFKLNHGCDYYHYIITFIDRLITLLPIKPLGLTMDAVISSPSKSLGSPRKCT